MAAIPASIEITSKQVIEMAGLCKFLPPSTRVYLPDMGIEDGFEVHAARKLVDHGVVAVPHIAARRLTTRAKFRDRMARLTQEGGVQDVLIIGGDLSEPAGEFTDSLQVLETGVLDLFGVTEIGVGGHPEGSQDIPADVAMSALKFKQAFVERSNATMRIVTQFGLNPEKIISWTRELSHHGIVLPVHIGIAGPSNITTLLQYAEICGVRNSLSFLKKRSRSLYRLASSYSPEDVLKPIEKFFQSDANCPIVQMHVFPFGGVKPAARWLEERGSWPSSDMDHGKLVTNTNGLEG